MGIASKVGGRRNSLLSERWSPPIRHLMGRDDGIMLSRTLQGKMITINKMYRICFSINKATDNLIITFGFDSISFNGYAHVKFYRLGREPFVTSDYAGANFGNLPL